MEERGGERGRGSRVRNEVSGSTAGAVNQFGDIHGELHLHMARHPAPDGTPTPERVRATVAAYAERIRQSWGHLDLEVLLPLDHQGHHPPMWLREVFVEPGLRADPPPVELPRELVRRLMDSGELPDSEELPGGTLDALKEVRDAYTRRPVRGALQVLREEGARRTVLLGDPGAGKSTLAKYLALTLANERLQDPPDGDVRGRVGVLVELRRYAEAEWREKTFEEFLARRQEQAGLCVPADVLRQLLGTGGALVVFDGLDEIFDPRRRASVAEQIGAFAARWPSAQIVVTSRVIGYKRHTLEGADFAHHMLQDLSPEQIARFTHRWYALSCPADEEEASRLATRLQDAVRDSRPVRELAGNPLLLTILAIVGRRQPLPKDRQGVYRQAVTVLTAQWDQQAKHLEAALPADIKDVLDVLDREEVLRLVARSMQEGTAGIAGNHIHGEHLEQLLVDHLQEYELPLVQAKQGARALVSQLRERNFILARYGAEIYGFVHRAFLEHLAASDIYERYTRGRAWTPDQLLDEIIAGHADDPAWHEVLLLLIGRLEPGDAAGAIDRLLDLHDARPRRSEAPLLVLAIRALAEVPKVGRMNGQSVRAVRAVTKLLNTAPDHPLEAAMPAFASFSPHWAGRELFLNWFRTRGQFARSSGATRIACALRPESSELLRLVHCSWNSHVRGTFLSALAERREKGPETRTLAFGLARADEQIMRREALKVLAKHWGADPEVRALLFDRARNDQHRFVRADALSLLAKHWAEDARLRALTLDLVHNDQDESVCIGALLILAGHRTDDPQVHTLALDLLHSDRHPIMRRQALSVLAERGRDDPHVHALLLDLVHNDRDGPVRDGALRLLAKHWMDDPQSHALALELVHNDPEDFVRHGALRLLAKHWMDDPQSHALALELVHNDQGWFVRQTALGLLTERPGDIPAAHALTLDLAHNDPHASVRGDALRVAAERWEEDPHVHALTLDLARNDPHESVRGTALRVLAERRRDDPRVHALAVELARNDPCRFVRQTALDLLTERSGNDPEIRALTVDLVRNDQVDHVRMLALHALTEYWEEDPQVRALVLELARNEDGLNQLARCHALTVLALANPHEAETHAAIRHALNAEDPDVRAVAQRLDAGLSAAAGPAATGVNGDTPA